MSSRTTRRLPASTDAVREAGAALRAGKLVAFPTETVYGLGADATDGAAVAALYDAKGRPSFNPLIVHVPSADDAARHGRFNADARRLAAAFWPGPLTLVLPFNGSGVHDLARAGLNTVAVRVPAHPVARAVLEAAGRPVVAPSANRSGRLSPVDALAVMDDLAGRIDLVLDAGRAPVGVESTIVACLDGPPVLLRPGGVTREAIEALLGSRLLDAEPDQERGGGDAALLSPGRLASHYAPRARVRLDAKSIFPGEAALLFGPSPPADVAGAVVALNLSPAGDLSEAAAHLFAHLRALDAELTRRGVADPTIAVAPVGGAGLGEAIRDRLRRAAAERA